MVKNTAQTPIVQNLTVSDLASLYINNVSIAKSSTVLTRLTWFTTFYGNRVAHELIGEDVEDMLVELEKKSPSGKQLANSTINRYRSTLQALLTYGRRRRLFPRGWANPVSDTEKRPESQGRTRFLSKDEYERLIKMARFSRWKKLPLIIMLAMTTGARRGNLVELCWSDIDIERSEIKLGKTKNGSPHICVITDTAMAELKRFKRGKEDELVFNSARMPNRPFCFNKAFNQALKDAGIEGVVFHSLRHSHASHLAQSGASLLEIAESLNHRTMSMVQRYAHLNTENRAQMIRKVFA
jgi:integrase